VSDPQPTPERPAGAPAPPAPKPEGGAPWPGAGAFPKAAPLPRAAVLACLAAGLVGAVAIGERIGAGVLLCALAVGVAGRLGRGERLDGWSRVWAALAAALAVSAMLRDAPWVVLPALAGAAALMSLALAGGAGWAAVAGGLGRFAARLGPGPLAVAAGTWRMLPVGAGATPALRGAALAVALVAVFGALFASGDAAFERLAATAIPDADLDSLPVRVFWGLFALTLAGALASAARPAAETAGGGAPGRRLAPVEWVPALGALNLLFAAFVAVQASVLFGKRDHVLETAGLTYAEYAREGFGQLAVAAALTLAVAAGALRWARAETVRERMLLRALLALLCGLTLVVVASAAHRLDLYQDAFGATRLRLVAGATIAWLGALLALVLAAVSAARYAALPRACVLVTALVALGVVLIDPDRHVAERNVERYARDGKIDLDYLRGLSADAAPALAELPQEERYYALTDLRLRLPDREGWTDWNLARARARDVLREQAP
jgi:hypothetical protein